MPVNINPHLMHHPFVNAQELPFPSVVLPGGGRLAIYPGVKTRLPGPGLGIGAGVMGMPHPLGGPLAWGAGIGLDSTAASWRRYAGINGYIIGRPMSDHNAMPGAGGMGGYWGGWSMRD